MAKNDFQYAGWNSYTLQCDTITTLISSGDCTLQCGIWLWHRDSEFVSLLACLSVAKMQKNAIFSKTKLSIDDL